MTRGFWSLLLAAPAAAGGRAQVAEADLFGGAIEAVVATAAPDHTTPAVLDGVEQEGEADLLLIVELRYAAAGVLGGRNAGEFVPYQRVRARIAAGDDDALEFDLPPHVGLDAGWHYASNVALPAGPDAPYDLTIAIEPAMPILPHADAVPRSRLIESAEPTVVFDGPVLFGTIAALPVGDVAQQQARVAAYATIQAALDEGDFAGAAVVFEDVLAGPVESRMDPAGYDAARGLNAAELADLLPNLEAALARESVGLDCFTAGAARDAECKEWVKKGLERFFYLAVLHEVDEAAEAIAEGALDARDGAAHKWDEAWAYWQALRETAGKRQMNCDAGRFGAGVECGMDGAIEDALLDGANALVGAGGAGWEGARATVERKLLQLFYLDVVHELIAMREKILAGDEPGYQKARVEARAFYRTIAYLVPAADDAVFDATFGSREFAFAQGTAADLVARLDAALDGRLAAAELADPEVTP